MGQLLVSSTNAVLTELPNRLATLPGVVASILLDLEQKVKHDMPKDGDPNKHTDPQLEGARQMLLDPIGIIYCPSRGLLEEPAALVGIPAWADKDIGRRRVSSFPTRADIE